MDVVTIRAGKEARRDQAGKAPGHPAPRTGRARAYSPIHWRKKSYKSGAFGSIREREASVKQGLGDSWRMFGDE